MTTAVIGVREMLEEVIDADMTLNDLLSGRKVFTGKAPAKASLNYIVLGQTTETSQGAGYYRQHGHAGTESLHCWARNKWTAQQIYARLAELLDRQRPIISGHKVMKGILEYVTDADEVVNGVTVAWQVVARYRVKSLEEV